MTIIASLSSSRKCLVKNIADFPPEFDPDYYRARYPELALASDAQAEMHFRDHGLAAGLEGSPLVHRARFINEINRHEEGSALEIGPSWSPILRGPRVAYLDVFTAGELRARAQKHGVDPDLCPADIDFVGDIADVDRKFDYVISSHSIEHQPDLVHHLKCVHDLLNSGGRYYLIIPDKRFCFDACKAESTIAGVLQAHKERRTHHTLQSVIEGAAFSTHNDATLHWQGAPDPVDDGELADRIEYALKEFEAAGGGYIDVHAWYFTPASFKSIASTLFKLGLTGLQPIRVFNTPRNALEFCAVLEKVQPHEEKNVVKNF
jgi:SAM-dependent methyltransferase